MELVAMYKDNIDEHHNTHAVFDRIFTFVTWSVPNTNSPTVALHNVAHIVPFMWSCTNSGKLYTQCQWVNFCRSSDWP